MGVSWNLTNPLRVHQQVTAQQWTSKGLESEYELVSQQIKTQLALADRKIKNALANYQEAPVQMKAASDAYLQKTVLYTNGLTNIVDITQALYTLNRAETDVKLRITMYGRPCCLKRRPVGISACLKMNLNRTSWSQ